MAVLKLTVHSRTPFAGGQSFGETGPYERLDGVLSYGVDPKHPGNASIVDLHHASQDGNGLVGFEGDFCLLQPVDPMRGSGRLLFDVLNRGRRLAVGMFNRCRYSAAPPAEIDPGDGFLMRRGWSIAWAGWQWDVVRGAALMGLDAPQALGQDGVPLAGRVLCQFQPVNRDPDRLLADRIHHPYPAAGVEDTEAELAEREWPGGPRQLIPRERWRFARDHDGAPVADDTRVWLEGGFEPGKVYEVIYRTRICPVVGTGLLAVRDAVSFLRHGGDVEGNPCAGRVRQAYGFGMSQSGRLLRHFLYLGLNLDEDGRQVFDGLHVHVAGARRGEFNHRYAQPSVQNVRGFGHLPPFATRDVLAKQRSLGGTPQIIETNTGAEYWRGDCSLLHTDLSGGWDSVLPEGVRSYYLAGTQHVPGAVPPGRVGPDGARSANPGNALDYSTLLRAALINLDRWVTDHERPPVSRYPRLADGTAVTAAEALPVFRRLPGAAVPAPDLLPAMVRIDLGPESEHGVGRYPVEPGAPYKTYVSAVDGDGNERSGVRAPGLQVPLATYTGWNPRAVDTGGEGQIISMQGSTFPFSPTEAERKETGDPRPSIEARYKGREDYLDRAREASQGLVAQGYLLAEDVQVEVEMAAERWDAWARLPQVGLV